MWLKGGEVQTLFDECTLNFYIANRKVKRYINKKIDDLTDYSALSAVFFGVFQAFQSVISQR